jgi:hypothetical protein
MRNMYGGLWWRFRCSKCLKVKLESNAGFYTTRAAVATAARKRGWRVTFGGPRWGTQEIICLCPKCAA